MHEGVKYSLHRGVMGLNALGEAGSNHCLVQSWTLYTHNNNNNNNIYIYTYHLHTSTYPLAPVRLASCTSHTGARKA